VTAPPAFVLEEIRRRRERRGPLWNGALITIAFVAAGFVVASMTLSPVPTPRNVATAYTEARFDRDWSAAWELLCRPARAMHGDFAAYADSSADGFHFMPRDVDVSTGPVHAVDGVPSAVAVPVAVISEDPYYQDWEIDGDLMVVREDDELRVCDQGVLPN
jgi:hypothetical protein